MIDIIHMTYIFQTSHRQSEGDLCVNLPQEPSPSKATGQEDSTGLPGPALEYARHLPSGPQLSPLTQ